MAIHGFKKRGRSITLNIEPAVNRDNQNNLNYSQNTFYRPGKSDSLAIQNQRQAINSNISNFGFKVSYTEPLAKKIGLVLSQGIKWQKNEMDRSIYQLGDEGTEVFDADLSTAYESNNSTSTSGLSIAYDGAKFRATVGASLIQYKLNNQLFDESVEFKYRGANILPTANLSYQITKYQRASLDVLPYLVQPAINQLQPVADYSNPLNVVIGNPNLKPALYNSINLGYTLIDPFKNIMVFTGLNYTIVQNQIQSAGQYQANGSQVNTFINANGNNMLRFYSQVKRSWMTPTVQKSITFGLNANQGHNTTSINGVNTISNSLDFSPSVIATYNYDNIIDVSQSYSPIINRIAYETDAIPKQNFVIQSLKTDLRITWPNVFQLDNSIGYNYNSQAPEGFKKGSLLWNANIGKELFRNKVGLIKLTVYDLLKQNNNVRRMAVGNIIEDTQSAVLQQYFMFSFTYKFSAK
ncbi:outer membrane beta-barrel protein [Solitalea longa]